MPSVRRPRAPNPGSEPPNDQNEPPDKPPLQTRVVRYDYAVFVRLCGAASVVLVFASILKYREMPELTRYNFVFALCKSVFLLAASYQCVKVAPFMIVANVALDVFWLNVNLPAWTLYHSFCAYMIAIIKTALTVVVWYDSADNMEEKGMAVFMVVLFVTNVIDTLFNCKRHWNDVSFGEGYTTMVLSTVKAESDGQQHAGEMFSFHTVWFIPAFFVVCTSLNVLKLYGVTALAQVTHLSCPCLFFSSVLGFCLPLTCCHPQYQYTDAKVMQVPEHIVKGTFQLIVQTIRNTVPELWNSLVWTSSNDGIKRQTTTPETERRDENSTPTVKRSTSMAQDDYCSNKPSSDRASTCEDWYNMLSF
jgi:hypothetical protein